jgi:hypothetical protein
MALAASLGDDGPTGVEETSTAIGDNSNRSSQDSGSRATTFSMSLASVSAAAAGPEPSDKGMVDLDGDVRKAQAVAAEDGVKKASQLFAHGDILPEQWAEYNSNQRKKYLKRRNSMGKK